MLILARRLSSLSTSYFGCPADLEDHYQSGPFDPYPLLQLDELRLQPEQFGLVHPARQPGPP